MNFYVPIAPTVEDAENLRDHMREVLKAFGLPTRKRRIRALACADEDGEDEQYIMVGGDLDDEAASEDPVLLIFEAKKPKRTFYFVTLRVLAERERPWIMKLGKPWRVVEFDDG
jgi:hypothetical protein